MGPPFTSAVTSPSSAWCCRLLLDLQDPCPATTVPRKWYKKTNNEISTQQDKIHHVLQSWRWATIRTYSLLEGQCVTVHHNSKCSPWMCNLQHQKERGPHSNKHKRWKGFLCQQISVGPSFAKLTYTHTHTWDRLNNWQKKLQFSVNHPYGKKKETEMSIHIL